MPITPDPIGIDTTYGGVALRKVEVEIPFSDRIQPVKLPMAMPKN